MEFITYIDIPTTDLNIDHSTATMLLGSCFASRVGNRLQQHKFNVDVNPFGILYNPFSISGAIRRVLQRRGFTEADLVKHQGMYHSFMHHGDFSSPDKEAALKKISSRFEHATRAIRETDLFLITFGTSHVYWRMESGEVVANCHKFPEGEFHRARLTVDDIVEEWNELIGMLLEIRPHAKLLFTVSPIRHWKDGAHENQLSKSILHLSIDKLQRNFADHVQYFPAYELMIDELRDYRFYDEDMLHPSPVAEEYIWQRFSGTFFSDQTRVINTEWARIRKSLEHRPLHPDGEMYSQFLKDTLLKLDTFSKKYPAISCQEERNELIAKINRHTS